MDLATLSMADLLAEKAKIEAARVKAVAAQKAAAAPIVAEQFRRAREAQIVARLRNNEQPKPAEIEYLAGLSDDAVAALEEDAAASADECREKNPAWHPKRTVRKYDLMTLVRAARE